MGGMDRSSSFDRPGTGAGYSSSQRGGYAGSADRLGQGGQTMRVQDRQAGRTERTQARTDLGGERQQARTDRTQSRQDTRAGRIEGRQDVQGDRQDNRTDRQGTRQENVTDRQENRQQYREGAREDWQDYYDDHYHGHWDSPWGYAAVGAAAVTAAYAIGTVVTASTFATLPCTPTTVVVGGVTYYQCGPTWYSQAYSGGDVTYVVVEAPRGY